MARRERSTDGTSCPSSFGITSRVVGADREAKARAASDRDDDACADEPAVVRPGSVTESAASAASSPAGLIADS
jgi:hypothetical protein